MSSLTYSELIRYHEDWHQEIIQYLSGGSWSETITNLQILHRRDSTELATEVPPQDLEDFQSTIYNRLESYQIAAWRAAGNAAAAEKFISWFPGRKGATVALLRAAVPEQPLKARLDEMVQRYHVATQKPTGPTTTINNIGRIGTL